MRWRILSCRVKNYNVSIKELNNKVIFLRKLKRGGSEHSFGIHVARMAGMPRSVVSRADEILKELEQSHDETGTCKTYCRYCRTQGRNAAEYLSAR